MRVYVFILLYLNFRISLIAGNNEKIVICEYSSTNWEPLGTTLYTCDIMTQTINSPGFKIEFQVGETERVEGLSFNDNGNLNYLPENIGAIFPNLKAISGSKSYLQLLSKNDFEGLAFLKYLNLAGTDLKVIEEESFKDLSNLEELDISDCDIRFIDENAFRGLSSLKTLYIGANKLTTLEPKTFASLKSLSSLSMELNHLEHVDDNLFATNENLADIWMNGNKIISMSWKVFENLLQLSYIDLQNNPCVDGVFDESNFDDLKEILNEKCGASFNTKITYEKSKDVIELIADTHEPVRTEFNIDGDADIQSSTQVIKFIKPTVITDVESEDVLIEFKNDPSTKTVECTLNNLHWKLTDAELETCDIDNQIIDTKGFKILPIDEAKKSNLKAISFAQNKNIKFLPENIGKVAPNIVEFSARNASLQILSKKNFAGLGNLRSLNLANNYIKHIDPDSFDDLSSLEELDLSGNDLEIIDEEVFSKLKNLKTLRLSNNKIHSIHQNMFKNLRNLVNVSISNQHIEKIPEKLFNTNLKLQNIWLNSNKLKSISPNMFDKLKNLEYLDMRDNKCIDNIYDMSKFDTMSDEIFEKCGAGYKLKNGVKTETLQTSSKKDKKKEKGKKNKKKKEKLPKVSQTFDSSEEKEVMCEYENVFWPSVNKTLQTCVVTDAIDDENYFLNANILQFDDFNDVADIQAIQFKNAKFLPKNIGDVFPNLLQFSAANSGLTSLNPKSFEGLAKLKRLDLSGNRIEALDPKVFKELSSLEELIIDDNEIEEFEDEIFEYFKVLKKLRMKGNKLKYIEESWFEEMPELHDMSFDIINSIHINPQMFKKIPKLKYIVMNGEFYDSNMTPIDESLIDDYELEEIVKEPKDQKIEILPKEEMKEIQCSYQINENSPKICEIGTNEIIDSTNYLFKNHPYNDNIEEIIIHNNPNIQYLPQNLGKSFPNLKKLNIYNSSLSSINQKTFESMPNLKTVDIIKTNLKSIESDTFNELPQLEELDLSENPIEILEEGIFDKLRMLKTLNLGKNELHFIHPKTFKFLTKLNRLSLSKNKLSVLDSSVFKNNLDLREIELDENPIQNLNPKMFDRLNNLVKVNFLNSNCIDGIFQPSKFELLKNTIEKNCEISAKSSNKEIYCQFKNDNEPSEETMDTCVIDQDQAIDEPDFKISIDATDIDPNEIKTLNITNNHENNYLPTNIDIFPKLINFYANNNSITDISDETFANMINLEKLNLSNNKIKSIKPSLFNDLLMLEILDLSNNDINEIDEDTFSKLTNLKKINISGNKIKKISKEAFEKSPYLEEITMDEIDGFNPEDLDVNDQVEIKTISKKVYKMHPDYELEIKSSDEDSETLDYGIVLSKEKSDEKNQPDESLGVDFKLPENNEIESYDLDLNKTNEVICEVENIELIIDQNDKQIFACVFYDMPIMNENVKIKQTDIDPIIEAVVIDNVEGMKFLPSNLDLFPNLVSVSAKNNSIESISPETLRNLKNLKFLDLSNNKITKLHPEILNDTPLLEEINLSGNKIQELPQEIFSNTPLLKNINISENQITNISPNVFENLLNLKSLFVDDISFELEDILKKSNPQVIIEKLHKTFSTTTDEATENSSIFHTLTPMIEIATTQPTTTSTIRRKIASYFTTTTTMKPDIIIPIKCDIIFEQSEYLGKNVIKCDISKQEIDDPEISLEDVENGKSVETLKIENNKNVRYLPENIAQIIPNLIEVSAKNSGIDSILPGDFEGLNRLESINLSGNNLKSIEPENFNGLNRLKKLDLSNNEIEFIDEDAFDLPQLTNLNLENNDITFLHPKVFEKLPNLQSLNIDGNSLSNLHENIFSKNPKLKKLAHSIKNFIIPTQKTTTKSPITIITTFSKQLPTKQPQTYATRAPTLNKELECEYGNIYWTFSDDELFTCDLKDSIIDYPDLKIKSSPRNKRVRGLSFVDNKNMKFLPTNLANEFPNLLEISAFNTSLKNIPKNAFSNLTRLRNLQLMSSDILSIDPKAFENLPSLESLDLSNNHLSNLPSNVLESSPSLKSLYIANNNLDKIDPKFLENVPDLRNISFENNKLSQIDKKLFGKNYELQNVWLNGNRINAIDPTIFDGKRALEYVDFRGNDCIDDFFEAYAIEGIRNQLRQSCKTTEESNSVLKTTPRAKGINFKTTVKPRPLYTTDKSVLKEKMTTTESVTESITQKRGPQSFILSQKMATTTRSPFKELKCTLSFHDFPNEQIPIYTCLIDDQPIDDENYKIKSTPHNSYVEGLSIDDNSNVKFLPKNIGSIFQNLKYLSARNNSLNNIPREALEKLQNLKNIDFSDNNFSEIDRESFANVPNLEELNLSGNNIRYLFNETFPNFPKLRDLDLSRNEIDTIDFGAFSKMPQLQKLSLENNEIVELPETIFKDNSKLETVNLSGNKIRSMHPEIFENLPQLREVNLDENNCIGGHYKDGSFYAMKYDLRRNCLPNKLVPSTINQTTTDIPNENLIKKSNEIECEFSDTYSPSTEDYLTSCLIDTGKMIENPSKWNIKETPSNKRVKRFVIDGNKNAKSLPKNLAENFPEMSEIFVTNVPLKSTLPDDFKNLNKLHTIIISNTSLKEIEPKTFSGAPNLQILNLSNNNLRHIDEDSFDGIPKLKTLDLSGNKIPKLSNEVFMNLPQLTDIKLTGNDLHTVDGDLFKKNPKLYKINLSDNNLKTIDPTAFDRLPQLIHLDLSKNECIDRSFGTSTMHLMRKIVNENCMPYKTLKNELRMCKKEVEKCRAIAKENEFNRSNGDDNVRDSLQKAEFEIRQLNLQINKLRKALNDEKNLLSKEIEKSKSLQKKLDQVKHNCARIDENHNFLIDLNCEFHDDDNKYSCFVQNLKIVSPNSTIEYTKGDHRPNKGKYDVSSLIISNQDLKSIPNGISNQFPYLKELTIDNSKLAAINNHAALRNLSYLTNLTIKGNDIGNLSPNAFDNLPQLEQLDLSQNNLKELPFGIFEKLPNLKVLNLNDNALLSLPHDIIPKANKLRKFIVSRNNNLKFIDPRLFPKLKNAEVIDFSNNKCIDEKFDANIHDKNINFMSFIGRVNMKCINNGDDDDDDDGDENGFCKGRKAL